MASNEIQGIDGIGARHNIQSTTPAGSSAPTAGSHANHAQHNAQINTHDVTHFSPDVDELAGSTAASAAQSGIGVPGMHAGQTITSGGVSNATPGISNAGVIISGRAPENPLVAGSAGRIFS